MSDRGRATGTDALAPMLASPGSVGDVVDGHAYEFKWDGVRALVVTDGEALTVRSRRGNDVTATYPELHALARALGRPAALDGEIVAFEPGTGRPSFGRIQQRMNVADPIRVEAVRRDVPVAYLAFDVLMLDGEILTGRPYEERRGLLEGLGLAGPCWQVPPRGDDLGAMLDVASDLGLEGVVAKRLGSTYRPGVRSPDWRKIRLLRRQEFVVGGLKRGEGRRQGSFGSLLLGYHDDEGRLRYAGNVGSGFTERDLEQLLRLLQERRRPDSPFADPVPGRGHTFVDPELVVEVQFSEWTSDGLLRQPSYKGLRNDKDAADVVRET